MNLSNTSSIHTTYTKMESQSENIFERERTTREKKNKIVNTTTTTTTTTAATTAAAAYL